MNLCRENDCMIDLMYELLKPFSGYMVGVELNATLMTLLKETAALFLFYWWSSLKVVQNFKFHAGITNPLLCTRNW